MPIPTDQLDIFYSRQSKNEFDEDLMKKGGRSGRPPLENFFKKLDFDLDMTLKTLLRRSVMVFISDFQLVLVNSCLSI